MDWLIAGLGNPGREYEDTRHNAGFRVIDILAGRWGIKKIKKLKFRSLYAEHAGSVLLKPQTFMNLSGQAIRQAAEFYKLPPGRVIVVFDDVSLPLGKIRVRAKGSDGGHNGMKDILYHLQSDAFPRVRIGLGANPRPGADLSDWVLGRFTPGEIPVILKAFDLAADAAEEILKNGAESAMAKYN
ncbi:MAG: aminoacyl-tRNA hydrolase [Oscillospiraceae bacterium]|jgi:PTH1 family peptidyl-tRNA hydrolase|nr:aminoacyl-tRNA hydrolase [Oscillospiraceae bacterium]